MYNGTPEISQDGYLYSLNGVTDGNTGEELTGTISFGTNDTKINAASVTGTDDLGNTWTVTTEGTTSFTAATDYYQVGSSKKPATSITFSTTLPKDAEITAFSAKFGGFSDTAGTVTLKVDNTTVGTGSLNETADVTVTNSSSTNSHPYIHCKCTSRQ